MLNLTHSLTHNDHAFRCHYGHLKKAVVDLINTQVIIILAYLSIFTRHLMWLSCDLKFWHYRCNFFLYDATPYHHVRWW